MTDTALETLMDARYPVSELMKLECEDFALHLAEANGFIKGLFVTGNLTKEQVHTWHLNFIALTHQWEKCHERME